MTGGLALTERDRRIIAAAWSFGLTTAKTLRLLLSPQTSPATFRERLGRLHRSGHLIQQTFVAPGGQLWLYGVGRAALPIGEPAPWRPSLAQVAHTLAIADVVVQLTQPAVAPGVTITGWQGEAELRAWAPPDWPYPDARIFWQAGPRSGSWLVEVDRATESRAAWRRKLVRYLTAAHADPVLVVTTSQARAQNIAVVAADMGVAVLSTTFAAVAQGVEPEVLDARTRQRRPLVQASLQAEPSLATSRDIQPELPMPAADSDGAG